MGHFSEPTLSFGYEESVDVVSVSPQTGPYRRDSRLSVSIDRPFVRVWYVGLAVPSL